MSQPDSVLMTLATFRQNLRQLMQPEVLKQFAKFLEVSGNEDRSMLERYQWFSENAENGPDCRYAAMAKEFFLKNQAGDVADVIIWLYENWAQFYKAQGRK